MPFLRTFVLPAALVGLFSLPVSLAQEAPDASTRWVSVYGWVQIGERLAEAEQWPLAIGSYIEAHQQLKQLAETSPDFEPEMVAYRMEWLEEEMAQTKERLEGGEHGLMMKYLDFIESFELGQTQRFSNEFQVAYDTLAIARTLLDEIVAERPEEFKTAMSQQYGLLLDSIDWLRSQLDYEERSQPVVVVDTADWGTTQFIKEADLPEKTEVVSASGDLFPPLLRGSRSGSSLGASATVVDLEADDSNAPKLSIPAFRMSNKDSDSGE